MKYVKNVTTRNYALKGEINTPNGRDIITVNIISGGLYELDTHMKYINLEEAIASGSLVPLAEDLKEEKVEVTKVVPDNDKVENNPSEDPNIIPEVSVDNEPEMPAVEEVTTPDVAAEESADKSKFICPHCNAEYATEKGLSKHIEKVHSND